MVCMYVFHIFIGFGIEFMLLMKLKYLYSTKLTASFPKNVDMKNVI